MALRRYPVGNGSPDPAAWGPGAFCFSGACIISEVSGRTGEQVNRLVLFREIEQLLDSGFTGEIKLQCQFGAVRKYQLTEMREPGKERRSVERKG